MTPFKPNDKILELGGGSNPMMRHIPNITTVNMDVRQVPGVDIVRNLEEDFSDVGEYDGLFAQYIAEHISWRKVETFFKSCFNVVKGGGVAVFVVPDTYAQMQKILQKPADEITFDDSNFLFGGQDYPENTHKWLLSRPFVIKLLRDAGFGKVVIKEHPDPNARDMFVEAYKTELTTTLVTAVADPNIKINFGSFTVTFGNGWINADIRDVSPVAASKRHTFEICDVRKKVRWEDNSVSLITAHHLIEHLSRDDGRFFLKECFRILKPEGIIRLSTPDIETFISHLKAGDFTEKFAEEHEVKNAEDNADAFFRLAFMGHETIYTFNSLRRKMEEVGFTEVRKMPYSSSRSPEIMTETEDSFPDHSFYIEAIKPRSSTQTMNIVEDLSQVQGVQKAQEVPDYKKYLEG